jgi:hypothetical protein
MIKIKFENSLVNQANLVCFLAKELSLGYFSRYQYAVLPRQTKLRDGIYFPNLTYSRKFWRAIKRFKGESFVDEFPKTAREEILSKISLRTPLASQEVLLRSWRFLEPKFWAEVQKMNLFSQIIPKINSISCLLTPYGTAGSFSSKIVKGKIHVGMSLRNDRPVSDIAWNLLAIMLIVQNPDFGMKKWSEKQEIVNFLLYETQLAKIFGSKPKEIWAGPKDVLESKKYLQKLGFGPQSQIKTVSGNLYLGTKLARRHLSRQELKLLNFFLQNREKIVSHDEIFSHVWGQKDFSLWAITQLVHRLKSKIKACGVTGETILTIRNQGYLFP